MGLVFFFFFFFPVFSREKLQILRNIACIRLNNDAAAVSLARLEHRHNNLIEGSTRGRETYKNSCGRHSSLCFSFAELLSFRAVNSIYSSGYVCCSWMCLDDGDCFFQNFKPFGVSDLLGERIPVFSVGNVN